MNTKRSTKRALLLSALSLLLCVSMLVGSTFAWFTDSVTSGNNIIKSGNLDITLEYWNGAKWVDVKGSTEILDKTALYEPGYVQVAYLKLENVGDLALQYQLGVNIIKETAGVNQDGIEFKLSDYIYFGLVEAEPGDFATREAAVAALTGAKKISEGYSKADTMLAGAEALNLALVVYMPETVGNEANHNGKDVPTIELGINAIATQYTYEKDSFNEFYDKNAIIATTAEEAQAALDNATNHTTIMLVPGVNYGTLTFRQNASSKVVDITTAGGDAAGNEKYRSIENLTIIGTEGAVVDGFDFQVGWIAGSGASFVDIKNFIVKDVTFSGEETPFFLDGSMGSGLGIDGLTIVDCKMNDADNKDRFVFQQISGYKELIDKTTNEYVMTAGVKNLTITNCEVVGAYQVIESRAMENLTITNNLFKNIKARDMLITSDTAYHADKTYTGTITITGNTSVSGEERFIRASLNNSNAVVIIKDNSILNYMGADADFIKVTDGNNVTMENNTLEYGFSVTNDAELKTALETIKANKNFQNKEVTISLAAGEYSGDHVINQYPEWNGKTGANSNYSGGVPSGAPITKLVFEGQAGTVFTGNVTINGFGNAGTGFGSAAATTTFKNVTFDAANSIEANGEDYAVVYAYEAANNVTFEKCTFQNATHILLGDGSSKAVGLINVNNCEFNDGGCLSGYFETLNVNNTNVTAAKNGFINKSKAGNVTVTGGTMNVGKYFLRTSNSGVNMTVNNATISLYESEGAADLVKFRGSSESATFNGCNLPASYETAGVDGNSILTIN